MTDRRKSRCDFCGQVHASNIQREDREADGCAPATEPTLLIHNTRGIGIYSVDDWSQHSPPKGGEAQWKDGASAKECAKAWCRAAAPAIPEELSAVLESNEATAGFRAATGIPEFETRLDNRGRGRVADLIVMGLARGCPTLVSIEAKAGEDFGPLITARLREALEKSGVPDRLNDLSRAVFGRPLLTVDREIGHLRYQLLHALAGTLIEGRRRGAQQVVVAVHQLSTEGLVARECFQDFQSFVAVLTGRRPEDVEPGILVPVTVPGGERVPGDLPVFMGWAGVPVLSSRAERELRRAVGSSRFDEPMTIKLVAHLRDAGLLGDTDWQRVLGWAAEAGKFLCGVGKTAETVVTLDADPRNADWLRIVRASRLAGYRLPAWAALWLWWLRHDCEDAAYWGAIGRVAGEMGLRALEAEERGAEPV